MYPFNGTDGALMTWTGNNGTDYANLGLDEAGFLKEVQMDYFQEPSSSNGTTCDLPESPLNFIHCSKTNAALVGVLLKAIGLGLIVLFTIFGNVLVLLAVAVSRNLRSSTHFLIVNLAVADLLLGTTVLPFSAVNEVTGRWYFGQTFCTIWAAVDVLCCTSSILSLCVISLDRYIGVTRPLTYSAIMVSRRTTILIFLIWTSSIAISIGPLLGWKEPPSTDPFHCAVNTQPLYVVFSVTGSFYLPMIIIIFVYWRIYKAAIKQTKFLESGQKTTKQDITLRVHLGGNRGMNNLAKERHLIRKHQQQPSHSAASGSGADLSMGAAELNIMSMSLAAPLARPEKSTSSLTNENINDHHNMSDLVLRAHRGGGGNANGKVQADNWRNGNGNGNYPPGRGNKRAYATNPHKHNGRGQCNEHTHHHTNNKGRPVDSLTPSPPSSSPERKLNQGFGKIAKFRRQKKAAKTLAVVVGVFLVCWFPFFFVLPLGTFCEPCKPPEWLFNLFFWLGYFNSCLNPIIYGCTSREFQRAFRRILCRRLPQRPHVSRAIYRANLYNKENNNRDRERPSHNGHDRAINGPNNGNAIALHQWS